MHAPLFGHNNWIFCYLLGHHFKCFLFRFSNFFSMKWMQPKNPGKMGGSVLIDDIYLFYHVLLYTLHTHTNNCIWWNWINNSNATLHSKLASTFQHASIFHAHLHTCHQFTVCHFVDSARIWVVFSFLQRYAFHKFMI